MKFYLLLLTSFLFGCNNNNTANKTTNTPPKGTPIYISGYARVISELDADIHIEVNTDSPYYCHLDCEKSLIPMISFDITNDELRIRSKEDIHTSQPIVINMRVKDLTSVQNTSSGTIDIKGFTKAMQFNIANQGSGNISLNHLQSDRLTINSSGSGNIEVDGKTKSLSAKLLGSGSIKTFGLKTEDADTRITGSGNIEVSPSGNLDAQIIGSGNIFYKGNPAIRNNITGSGMLSAK